ncbi:MAG: FtsX-like permease family protein [Clostridiales bacterium]|nr:FtsX-like permease family protein [Clostridiales bacterium]
MTDLFMIVKNNMKRQKGDMVTFLVMTLISSFLIYNAFVSLFGAGKVVDKRFEEINGADEVFIIDDSEGSRDALEKALDRDEIEDYEAVDLLAFTCEYRSGSDEDFQTFTFLAESVENGNRIMDVVPEGTSLSENGVLIPYCMGTAFEEGDTLVLKIEDEIYELTVEGYTENPYYCSTMNINVYYLYLSPSMVDELAAHSGNGMAPAVVKDRLYNCTAKEGTDLEKLEQEISEAYNKNIAPWAEADPAHFYELDITLNWSSMRMGDMIFPSIVSAMMLVFAVIILTISLTITIFSISNFIQRNMKNTGILEACGYTTKELRNALTIQIMSVAGVGTLAGILIAFLVSNKMGYLFSIIMGITWDQGTDILSGIITASGILLVVFVTVRLFSRKYKKITVLDALRGGITNHNFKRDFFPLDKTALPLPLVLSLKETFGSLRKNIAIVLMVAVLTVSALVGFGSLDSFTLKEDGLLSVMGFEGGDLYLHAGEGYADDFSKLEGVTNVYVDQTAELTAEFGDESKKLNTIAVEDMKAAVNTVLIEGRKPQADNEVMITWPAANDLGASVGDVVTIASGDIRKEFIVVGLDQRMQQAGRSMMITMEGLDRLGAKSEVYDYYITAEDSITYDELKATVDRYAEENGEVFNCQDVQAVMMGTIETVTDAMKAICAVLAILTAVIVVFVESLLVRAKITKEWRGMGINKALGMNSGDLLAQITLSNIPAVVTGALLGVLVSGWAGRGFIKAAFSYMGIKKIAFEISFQWMAVVFIGLIAIALITSAAAGLKVKKIIPMEMITEE